MADRTGRSSTTARGGRSDRSTEPPAAVPPAPTRTGARPTRRRPVRGANDDPTVDDAGDTGSRGAAPGSGPAGSTTRGRLERIAVRPDITGPRVRLGVLWFFVATAAATAGRWWTGLLWAVLAGAAAREVLSCWSAPGRGNDVEPTGSSRSSGPIAELAVAVVVALAAAVPLAAAAGVGTAGAVLTGATLAAAAAALVGRGPGMAAVVAVVLPAVAAASVVLVVADQLPAGLFLILAVSLYDAGDFVSGAESPGRWEGPVTGIVGVMAVTFTMATFQIPPFDTTTAWIVGGITAVACPIGQWVTSAFLPTATAPTRAMRRLDAYVLAAPLFLAAVWTVG